MHITLNKLRYSFFSKCIRVLCAFLIFFQPLVSIAQENIELDEANRIVLIRSQLSPEQWSSLMTTLRSDSWQVINNGTLDLSYDEFHQLAHNAVFRNAGTVMCEVPANITELNLPLLDNLSTIQFYGTPQGIEPIHRTVNIQTWLNQGVVDFLSNEWGQTTHVHDEWSVHIKKHLDNTGLIRSDAILAIHSYNSLQPLTGIVEGYALRIKGFDAIHALLVSGYQNTLTIEDEGSEKGFVDVESTSSIGESSHFFDWAGLVYAKGKTHLRLPSQNGQNLDAMVNAYFDTKGLYIEASSTGKGGESTVRLHQDHLYSESVLNKLSQQNPELINYLTSLGIEAVGNTSYIGSEGINLSFQGTQRGQASIAGNIESDGPLKVFRADTLALLDDSELIIGLGGSIDANEWIINGLLDASASVSSTMLQTAANVRIGSQGIFKAGYMQVPPNVIDTIGKSTPRIWHNQGEVSIGTLNQQSKFILQNSGRFCVEKRDANSTEKVLRLQNNTGEVVSAFPVDSFYDQRFFSTSSVIKGSIQSLGRIWTRISDKIHASIPIRFEQSQRSGRDVKLLFPKQDVTFVSDLLVESHKAITVDAQTLNIEPKSCWISEEAILMAAQTHTDRSHIQMNGDLHAPYLSLKAFRLTGEGNLDGKDVALEADVGKKEEESGRDRSVHVGYFHYGPELTDFIVRSTGAVVLDFKIPTNEKYFPLKGGLDVQAHTITLKSSVKANGKIQFVADEPRTSGLSNLFIEANLLTLEDIALSTHNMNWTDSRQLEGRDIFLWYLGSDREIKEALVIPKGVRIKAKDQLSLQAQHSRINLHGILSGKTLDVDAKSVWINCTSRDLNSANRPSYFRGFSEAINIEGVDGVHASTPIATGEFSVKSRHFYSGSIDVRKLDVTTFFTGINSSRIQTQETSIIDAEELLLDDVTIQTGIESLILAGTYHRLHNLHASEANIEQTASTLVISGSSTAGHLATTGKTTVTGHLRVKSIKTSPEQRAIHFLGAVRTQQKELKLAAPLVTICDLDRDDEDPFDTLIIEGEKGLLEGQFRTHEGNIQFQRLLQINRARVMADVLSVFAPKLDVDQTLLVVDDLDVESEQANLTGMTVKGHHQDKAAHFRLTSDQAQLSPEQIHAQQAEIDLKQYEGGLAGAIKLAHDLADCDHVKMLAIKESLAIHEATHWRDNITVVVNDADVAAALSSGGHVGIETLTGATVTADMDVGSLLLSAERGNISICEAFIRTVRDAEIRAAMGDVEVKAAKMEAGSSIQAEGINLLLESLAVRSGSRGNYSDQLKQTSLKAAQSIYLQAQQNIRQVGVTTASGRDTRLQAGGHILDEALRLERQRLSRYKYGQTKEYELTHSVAHHEAGGGFSAVAGGGQVLDAPHIKAKKVTLLADSSIYIRDVRNVSEFEHKHHQEGWFSKKIIDKKSGKATSLGADIRSDQPAEIESLHGNLQLTNVRMQAPRTVLKAMEGVVELLQGVNESYLSDHQQKANFFWQSQKAEARQDKNYRASHFSGSIDLVAGKVLVEQVKGKTLGYLDEIERQSGGTTIKWLDEVHLRDLKEASGLAAPCAILISLAVTLATAGTGSALGAAFAGGALGLSGTSATIVAGMTQAVFTGLCSQSAIAIINNKGDLIKAAQSLASTDTLKSLAFSALTAGATAGLANVFQVNIGGGAKVFTEHLKEQALKGGINTGVSLLRGEKPEDAILNCLKGIAAGTLSSCMANEIGISYGNGDLDPVSHKLVHAALGAMTGAVISDDPVRGALGGAMGSFIAETVADLFKPDAIDTARLTTKARSVESQKGRRLTESEFKSLYAEEMQSYSSKIRTVQDWGKLTAATSALLAGGDVSTAQYTAANALDNNFAVLALYGVMAASACYSGYCVYSAYKEGGTVSALKQLGIEVATAAVCGAVGKVGAQVVRHVGGKTVGYFVGKMGFPSAEAAMEYVLAKNPGLRASLSGISSKIFADASKLTPASLKQVAKAETSIVQQVAKQVPKTEVSIAKGAITKEAAKEIPKFSKETMRLLGKTDKYKGQLFERAGKGKNETTLRAAWIERQGKQIPLAQETGRSFDHVTKVRQTQNGLMNHIEQLKSRIASPSVSVVEKQVLQQELSKASKLLDHTEKFVPRT